MFGSKKSKQSDASNSVNGKNLALNTLVKGTEVEGNIKTESDIRIDGTLIGNLSCAAKVIIGPSGTVDGDITCQSAVIEGSFKGVLDVEGNLTLKETAVINGKAAYDKLVVHQGAVINANIRRQGEHPTDNTIVKKVNSKSKQKVEA